MIAELNRFIKSGRGQAMLEFALVLPILLFLVMGIIEFGRIFSAYLTITELAREGARYGVVGNTDASIKTLIKNRATAITLTDGDITITPQDPANPRKRGNSLQVSIHYSVDIVVPLIAELIPDPFPLTASCTMRCE